MVWRAAVRGRRFQPRLAGTLALQAGTRYNPSHHA